MLNPDIMTIRQAAAKAKSEGMGYVSETALRRWVADGMLRVIPIGNRKLICWDTLLEFLRTGVEAPEIGLPTKARPTRIRRVS